MNIDTPKGMEEAKEWLQGMLAIIRDEELVPWFIPRSQSQYRLDKQHQVAWRETGPGDPETETVFKAIGWRVAKFEERN